MTSPEFGTPSADIPRPTATSISRAFWPQVVEYLKSDPGLWHPLEKSPFRPLSLRNIAAAKATKKDHSSRQLPNPLRDPHVQIAWRDKKLWLRWVEDES